MTVVVISQSCARCVFHLSVPVLLLMMLFKSPKAIRYWYKRSRGGVPCIPCSLARGRVDGTVLDLTDKNGRRVNMEGGHSV